MALPAFEQSLDEVEPLIELVRVGTVESTKLRTIGLDVTILPAATAGCIVLMVGRFEHFLRDVAERALGQYKLATPPVQRAALDESLQLVIIRANLSGAARQNVHGVKRTTADQIAAFTQISTRVVSNDIWGEEAIDTASNPGPDTVRSILKLLGLPDPWKVIETQFAIKWQARSVADPALKSIPRSHDELESILGWRNTIAHSRNSLPLGPGDLESALAFFEELASSIELVLRRRTDLLIKKAQCAPAAWT